jgi:hypothetical protein
MTAALLDPPVARAYHAPATTTLDRAIAKVWEDLTAHRTTACPVCAGPMQPRYGASGLAPVGGRCASCGSTLG